MTKQEQIEEMTKERNEMKDIMKLLDKCVSLNPMCKSEVASVLYGNNYRKLPEDSVVLSREEYEMCKNALTLITEQDQEIERLKDDYAKLQELFVQSQMASDKEIRAQIKQAKIDVLNELKGRLGQVKIDDTKIKFWKVTDMSGTLEQAPIDYKPVNIIIDELLKEYVK